MPGALAPPTPRPVTPAGVRPSLRIGPFLAFPVVLAPMAGVTNRAFRRLCREFAAATLPADGPGALFVSEMVSARALVQGNPVARRLLDHDPDERPRSVQLYAVDPVTARAAARLLVEEDRADHVDLNFGCPVPKVTRTGGGAALPWKRHLFAAVVGAVVAEAARRDVPVTVKMRLGIDAAHLTYLDAALLAEAEGAAAVTLHARTAAQSYSGQADWGAIRALKEHVAGIPVLGNGDVWSAGDAARMLEETGCDGVVVGRGCLGRPWLFADLAAALTGSPARRTPTLGDVATTMRRHAGYLVECSGDEERSCREFRRHVAWYLRGFPVGSALRTELARVDSLTRLDALLARLDPSAPWPGAAADGQRGRSGAPRRVVLPERWLDSPELTVPQQRRLLAAETAVSGG